MKLTAIKYIGYFAVITVIVATAGCTKFLEEKDPSNLTPDGYYTIPEHAESAIAAAYAQTRNPFTGGAGIFVNNFSMLEVVTGTAKSETGQNSDLNNLIGLVYNGDNLLVRNWWNSLYSVIAQTHLVLEKVPGINPMDAAQKNRILGEARFLRAWSYFYLVQLYGDVPLITKSIEADDPELYPSRASKDSVYDLIVSDLIAAEGSGLPWTDATGRVSMGAVKSLLARVYLTMAGHPMNKGASHYQLAATKANEVITNGSFRLFNTYNDLHNLALENRVEHIFQIQYHVGIATANALQQNMLPNFKGVSAFGTEIGTQVPTNQFFTSYEVGDRRVIDRQGFFYTNYYNEGSGALKPLSAPYIYKHFDVVAHGTAGVNGSTNSSMNWPQIRFADVLLMYAEAQNESGGGPNQGAWNALDSVRRRAGLVTPPLAGFTQATFREAVWRERWHELAYEGITWFDMVRLKKVYNEATNGFDNFVGHAFPDNGAVLAEKHLLFPLPTAEMQNNPNLKPQNPGYQ